MRKVADPKQFLQEGAEIPARRSRNRNLQILLTADCADDADKIISEIRVIRGQWIERIVAACVHVQT